MKNASDSERVTIHIRLLNEGVPVVRPAYAEILGDNIFRILPSENYDSHDEVWEFPPGTIVKCEMRKISSGEEVLMAVEKCE